MNLKNYLLKKAKAPKGKTTTDWLPFCTFDVTTGALWAGDPHLANADDSHVTTVPRGRYVVEGMGLASGRERCVARLRVRLEGVKDAAPGKELGETGTDSAMIGVCDIKAFNKACGRDSGEAVQKAIEAQTENCCGVIKLKEFPGAVMPFVPTGSDGTGPVLALMSGRKRVGIELSFLGEEEGAQQGSARGQGASSPSLASLLGSDQDGFMTRVLADGREASFWIGGEPTAGKKFYLWSDATPGPVYYRVRREGKAAPGAWSSLKKKKAAPLSATETLGPGKYEIDFRVGRDVYSALRLALA